MSDAVKDDMLANIEMLKWQTELAFDRGINLATRTIQLVGIVDETMFKFVDTAMTLLEQQGSEPVTVTVNSGGGHSYEGHAISARLRASPCRIRTVGYGTIMSAATPIFAAGHDRQMSKYAVAMVHESSSSFEGKSLEMKEYAKWCVQEELLYCNQMAELTNTDVKVWKQIIGSGRDKFFTAAQAVELGLAHATF